MEATEKQLLLQLKSASTRDQAYRTLISRYQQRVYGLVRKMVIDHDDADDIVQDVFVKVWSKLDSFNEESSLFTWIYRIAVNESLQFLRKKKRWTILGFGKHESLESKLFYQDSMSGDEIQLKLQQAILKLPDQQRAVFHMKYYDELKYTEIAEIMERSEGSLKANYHHAVTKIEKYLRDI